MRLVDVAMVQMIEPQQNEISETSALVVAGVGEPVSGTHLTVDA